MRLELREALARRTFALHFQPRVRLASGQVRGFEALLRWRRRDGSEVSPAIFIPIAENAGLIEPLTELVITQALATLARWRAAGHGALSMSLNVSAQHFLEPCLRVAIEREVRANALPASALTLEITESMVMRDPVKASAVMRELKALGVRIAIDDFGTGYSSLAYLRDLPLDEIKIDKSFTARIGLDERDDLIVAAIARMAESLKLDLVAEGVERAEQARFLLQLGVPEAQGFLFSRPVATEVAETLLRSKQTIDAS
jgi:EAL domain-containing protein (putative c-di-GMP-specific phosphodiesterase class I)